MDSVLHGHLKVKQKHTDRSNDFQFESGVFEQGLLNLIFDVVDGFLTVGSEFNSVDVIQLDEMGSQSCYIHELVVSNKNFPLGV